MWFQKKIWLVSYPSNYDFGGIKLSWQIGVRGAMELEDVLSRRHAPVLYNAIYAICWAG